MDSIERIAPPSPADFRDRYVRPRRPVIITGALEEWPARQLWSADYLIKQYGDRQLSIAAVVDKKVVNDGGSGIPYRDEPIASFIERMLNGDQPNGYAMVLLHQTLPELLDYLRTPAFAPPAPWSLYKFWMSAANTRSPLHMDLPDNLFAQLVGRKRVALFAPKQEWNMYRHAPWSRLPQVSRVDAEEPDLELYPRFARAKALRFEVEAGELLYIPRFWWHQIRSVDFSISVNYWWATGWVWKIVWLALAYQRLRALRF